MSSSVLHPSSAAAGASSPPPASAGASSSSKPRRSLKARPELSPWKQQLLEKCEKRLHNKRDELAQRIRSRITSPTQLLHDIMEEELQENGEEFRIKSRGLDTSISNWSHKEGEEEDDDLTPEERVELLLYLEETLYNSLNEDGETRRERSL